MKVFSKKNFKKEVLESEMPVLVDFWAEWCHPCKIISPVLQEIDKEYEGIIKIGKVNVDEEPELANKYNVMSIPTLAFFKNGKIVELLIGAVPKKEIIKKIEKIVK